MKKTNNSNTAADFPAPSIYAQIYATVKQIPRGKTASYGQIARLVGGCTPRMVGYAMAASPTGSAIPWHRVINSRGEISIRADGRPDSRQRRLLEAEGIAFDPRGRVDFTRFGWNP